MTVLPREPRCRTRSTLSEAGARCGDSRRSDALPVPGNPGEVLDVKGTFEVEQHERPTLADLPEQSHRFEFSGARMRCGRSVMDPPSYTGSADSSKSRDDEGLAVVAGANPAAELPMPRVQPARAACLKRRPLTVCDDSGAAKLQA